jgi:poly-gamma-glutamate synthesis protein (capsule biosynthesis protein)
MDTKEEYADCLVGRISLVNLANNHIYDKGLKGFQNTMKVFEERKIKYTGIGNNIKEAWGYEIVGDLALFSASFTCYNDRNQRDCDNVARLSDNIKHMDHTVRAIKSEHPDKLIVMQMHAGKEYDPFPDSQQRQYARNAIKVGVDVVIGHHVHVV